jgi:copper chaperone
METAMLNFEVKDMTCGHCVAAIGRAIGSVDPGAKVHVDLATHRVQIEAATSGAADLSDAIKAAGYTPVAVAGAAARPAETAPRGGCCCR